MRIIRNGRADAMGLAMSGCVFEAMEQARALSKAAFEEQAPALRIALVEAQRALDGADFPAIILFAGVDGAGKGEMVNLFNAWLDPRRIVTNAYDRLAEDEHQRPEFWRYWRDLPPKGPARAVFERVVFRSPGGPRLWAYRPGRAGRAADADRGIRADIGR